MTDTDIDIDIEPAFAAHLQRTLRGVAATVEPASDTDARNVVRLLTAPPPTDRRRPAWTWLGAAAVTGVVAGAGLMAVADREPDDAQVPVASTVPVEPGEDDAMYLAKACAQLVEEQISNDDGFVTPTPPELESASVIVFDTAVTGSLRRVAVIGPDALYTCIASALSVEDPTVTFEGDLLPLPAAPAPGADGVQVVGLTWTGNDAGTGPGSVYLLGRAGNDVTEVEAELPDGTLIPGDVSSGWFVVEGGIPAGVELGEERLNWVLVDGERRSSRADLLDASDPTELCAADADCVITELSNLRSRAESMGTADQADILSDLRVTEEERRAAHSREVACLNATGVGARLMEGGGVALPGFSFDDPDFDAKQARQRDVVILCGRAHSEFVDEAWNLLDAQRRVAEG